MDKLPNKLQMLNDIKQLKNRIKKLEEQIYFLKAENKKLKETKENKLFKFKINQLVFCVRRTTQRYETKCEFCDGEGEITGRNKAKCFCPVCCGDGKSKAIYKDIFKVYSGIIYKRNFEEKIVENIFPIHFKNKTLSLTTYQIDGIEGNVIEEYIFSTEKEANEFAEKLNKEQK